MSFFPCSECGQRERGKLASVYASWFNDKEQREAYRKRLCVNCLTSLMGSLKAGESADSSLMTVCPACGDDASQTLSGVYLTIYPPKQPEREYALTMCASCAVSLHDLLQNNADKLADRGNAGAAAPASTGADWGSVPW